MAEFIEAGTYARHIRRARLVYRRRRDRLVRALEDRLPNADIRGAAAGMHLVVELPPRMSEQDAVARGLERGIALEGLSDYRLGEQRRPPALVVGYGTPPEHAFTTAVARLCAVLSRD
jgi:GntR family transcriptional regulator/MocR family aminotransferase